MLNGRMTRAMAVLTLVGTLVLAGCGSSTPSNSSAPATPAAPAANAPADNIIKIGLNADPPKLDPHLSTALVDRQVFQALFDKLVDFDQNMNIVPMLAEKWEISDDGKVYTFHLRKGVKFHDGTDFNADAVKFNFDRELDPKLKTPRKSEINSVDKVEVVDPYTVKVTLKQPFAGFLAVLGDRAGMMVSPAAVQKYGDDFLNHPVGTGPFMFKERVKGDSITLVKNPNYWQAGLPKADGIVYKTVTDENVKLVNLQGGQLDIIDGVPAKQVDSLKSDNRLKVAIGPGLGYQGFYINVKKGVLADKRVRQAIDIAIDRDALVKVVFGSVATPADSPFPAGTPANDGKPARARDLAKAKQLVADAGATNATIGLKVSNSPVNQQIGQVIQSMLADAGLKVNLQVEEFGTILDEIDKKNFDMAQVGWSGRADPDGDIYTFFYTGGGNNDSDYSNQDVDKMLDDARIPTDMAKRKPIYDNIMKQLHEDVPYVFLWWPNNVNGVASYVKGYSMVADNMIRVANLTKK